MAGRFLDNAEFIKEAGDEFVKRRHGASLWGLTVAFILAFFLVLSSFIFVQMQGLFTVISVTAVIFISLAAVVFYFVLKDKTLIHAVELQNAIFAGVAKQSTDLCLIIRYNGDIIYITPEYSNKLFTGNRKENRSITALHESKIISKEGKEKLLSALAGGEKEKVNLNIPGLSGSRKRSSFLLEPIGVFYREKNNQRLSLAAKASQRPSGYFLLKSIKDKENRVFGDFSVGRYSLSKKNEFSFVDDNFEKQFAYNDGELISGSVAFKDLFFDKDKIKKLMAQEKDWQTIASMRNKKGSIVNCLVSHKIVKNKKGTISLNYGIVMPFSEKKSPAQGQSNNNAPDLVSMSPIATALLDDKGRVLRSNEAFRLIAEKHVKKTEKWNILDIVTESQTSEVQALLEEVSAGEHVGVSPVDITIDGDGEATASLYISRIIDEYGGGIIAHLIDTTELKNLEMRFVHSQKMQAVGQLAGGIAHDFNNLLTAMMGFCDLLLMRHPAGDQSFADIMQIKQNANRAANLVRQLLAFSRKQTLQPKVINITDVLADLSNLIGRLIGENIEPKMFYGRNLGDVKVDQGQLEQVIINLAVNARDAMDGGGVLTIKTSNVIIDSHNKLSRNMIPPAEDEVIEDGEYVLIEVGDTGCGITRDEIGKIFEPFYSTKKIGEGTGLGLATVYGIIKQTDGYIYVSSRIGKGSKFSIFLRRHKNIDGKNEPVIVNINKEISVMADLSGKGTILLVEDETPVRIFSNSALVSKGYKVFEAENAEVALNIIKEKGAEIDIIITDVVMPGMSGPDMTKKISKDYPDIKVIFMSGYGEDAFIESFGKDRKFNFLAKPYSLKQLAIKVKEVFEGR